ncbi:MAG: 2-isopropylmalate synthase [Finegoldia sp.]|nr:2-isopropylmalate synthase [Finegoldia sp.]
MTRTIKIFDTTLRDGEQSPGCSMNINEKIAMAKELEALNVDIIEAGFAAASPGDLESILEVSRNVERPVICSLARCVEGDIDLANEALKQAKHKRIHVFIATSPVHMQYKLKMSEDEVIASIDHHVRYAKNYCDDIEFSAEDASRSDLDFLCKAYGTAIKAGATTINIPDTVGYMLPDEYAQRVKYIRENTPGVENVTLSCHVHNDLGMAVAISLAGVKEGIDQIECTVNGIGERAGNAALEECVMALKTRKDFFGVDCNVNNERIYHASHMLENITGVKISPTKPIVGANAFAHEAGIHQHGVLANRETYEIMTPESVGIPKNSIVLGKHSGRHAFEERLKELGYELDKDALNTAFEKFKLLADKKKTIADKDLISLVGGDYRDTDHGKYMLDRYVINSGDTITPTASVRISEDGELIEKVAASKNGPIEASYAAIESIVGKEITLEDYSLDSMTEGRDAQAYCKVILAVEGEKVTGKGVSTDIIEASIKAYINAVNEYFGE